MDGRSSQRQLDFNTAYLFREQFVSPQVRFVKMRFGADVTSGKLQSGEI
jgi:hypothetical protein